MVESTIQLDTIFHSLADPIRRDILHRVAGNELSIGELVTQYTISFAAISKHIKVLEKARLVQKRQAGKKQMVVMVPGTLKQADEYLQRYQAMWSSRYSKLDKVLKEGK